MPPPAAVNGLSAYGLGRQVANTVGDGALYRHVTGDDAEAVDRLLDVLHVARSVGQDETVVGQLVALGVSALAQHRIQVIAPGLRAGDPAVRERAKRLIVELLDERGSAERYARGLVADRLDAGEVQARVSAGTWAIRPLSDREVAWANADHAVYAEAARQTTAAAADRVMAKLAPRPRDGKPWVFTPSWVLGTSGPPREVPDYAQWFAGLSGRLTRYFEQWHRNAGDRRAAAVAVAARLYRVDHAGRWPATLADLVPDYLSAVPADPYHEDGRPLGYKLLTGALPGGGDRPVVWYDAGDADDGEAALLGLEPLYGWQSRPEAASPPPGRKRSDPVRQYRDLARWMPADRRFERERAAEAAAAAKEAAEAEAAAKEAAREAAEAAKEPGV